MAWPSKQSRPAHRDHVLTGSTTLFLRILQLLIALTVVGLAAYGLTFLSFSGIIINMFTASVTVIFCTYLLISSTAWTRVYNYWAALFFDCFGFVFWLTSFALLTSQVRPFYASYYYDYDGCGFYYYGTCYYKRDLATNYGIKKRDKTNIYTYRNSMAACAAMAGLIWLVFCVTLVTTIIYLIEHRSEGGHAMCGRPRTLKIKGESRADLEMQPKGHGVQEPVVSQTTPVINSDIPAQQHAAN